MTTSARCLLLLDEKLQSAAAATVAAAASDDNDAVCRPNRPASIGRRDYLAYIRRKPDQYSARLTVGDGATLILPRDDYAV